MEIDDPGMVDGIVNVGSLKPVGVTDDSVGLDTVEMLRRGGNTTGEPGRDGPGIDGDDVAGKLGGSGVEGEETGSPNSGGRSGERILEGVRLETVEDGSGTFAASSSSRTLPSTEDGIVGILIAGLLTQ